MTIGFIGVGNMGGALAKAVAASGQAVVLSNHNPQKAQDLAQELPGAKLASNSEIVGTCSVIFLGVKPYQIQSLLTDLQVEIAQNPTALWISMAAGLTLDQLVAHLPDQAGIIRLMPNTPVAIGQGMSTYAVKVGEREQADRELFENLLATSGKLLQLPEHLIDAATGIAGCGPAFVYQFIEALADAGVKHGLQRQDSLNLAAQTLLGAASLVLETGQHPAVLRDQVTSPGGSTIAGVVALEEHGFRHAAIQAVTQAVARTRELGKD